MSRVLLAVLALSACTPAAPVAPAAAPREATRWVQPRPAAPPVLTAPATVVAAPESSALVSAPLPLRVERVRVRLGEKVAAQQVVAEVLVPQALLAAGALEAAQRRLEPQLRRLSQLEALKSEGLARAGELAEVQAAVAVARGDLASATATLRIAGVDPAQAARLLTGSGLISLRSPLAGVVTAVAAVPGATYEPGGPALAEIVAAGEVTVEARLPRRPRPGETFTFSPEPGVRVPCTLQQLSPRVDGRDGTVTAWLRPEGPLEAGRTGQLEVTPAPTEAVLSVPLRAVHVSDGAAVAVLRDAAGPVRHPVEVVSRLSDAVVVRGLPPGREVAADARAALEPAP
ncbi:MAG: efflux RND transporter periplasmic adaptor subunit [Myxococcaceae bacterium]|nr:efflux RND transporter periplasmic adaptor subunit [Myxococcaceae bacterium]